MSLSEIKRKLYQKEEDKDLSRHAESEYDPQAGEKKDTAASPEESAWAEKVDIEFEGKKQKSIRTGAIAFGIIIFVIVAIVGLYIYRTTSFNEERVVAQIAGPKDVGSGKLLSYTISYENDNRAVLNDAVLRISFPENFKPEDNAGFVQDGPTTGHWKLESIPGQGKGKKIFNGRVYSPQGALVYLKSDLYYTPSAFSSQYIARNQLGINVISTPLSLEIMAPENISSGDAVNYLITYKNNGVDDFENLKIKVDYPDGFTFTRSEPSSLEADNIWYVGRLPGGQEGKIVASGKIEGDRDAIKTARAYIGSVENGNFVAYNEENADTKISSSPLAIFQTVNGLTSLNVDADQTLNYEITFQNEGQIGLRDVIVTENIDSAALDYSSLRLDAGYYDANAKTITWKSSDYPILGNLEPGMGGTIKFSVKVKDILPIANENDRNFIISSLAKIDSPDIPTPIHLNKTIAGNKMDIKLNSKLILAVNGYYTDPNIPNSGPIPPKVGQETTYTIHWAVSNTTNDLGDVRVESVLPTGVVMTGQKLPEDSNFRFNERTNSVLWELGNVGAGTGILSGPKEVIFQVKIRPSIDQVGQEVEILGTSEASASDHFTGTRLTSSREAKTTYLREDSTIDAGQGSRVTN